LNAGLDHFNRVFDGAEIDLRRRQFFQGGVEGGGLARTRRPGDEDDAVGLAGHVLPAAQVVDGNPSWSKSLSRTSGSKIRMTIFSPKAVGRVDKRSSTSPPSGVLVFTRPSWGLRFSATFMRPRVFQATDDGHSDLGRELIDVVQHAVDAKAHRALLAPGFDVDVAGTLLERVLEQPVDDVDDVCVVGVRLLVAGAEVEQLFEIAEGY